jgi:hypothetical protein
MSWKAGPTSRFDAFFNISMSAAVMKAVEREAGTRQQTIAAYCRDALLLKRAGVRIRPLRNTKQTAN